MFNLDLPALEKNVLEFWHSQNIFSKSLDNTKPVWRFLEGPPTMNGSPGVHHVAPRAVKDLFARYKTMQGYYVPRFAGWDCHGLPVELSVSKEYGLNRQDMLDAGLQDFSKKCRESVEKHQKVFEELTLRMGYWLDFENCYRTMDNVFVEKTWSTLAELFNKGLLSKDYRVSPWCTSCQTALSSHEVAQEYQKVTDTSLFLYLKLHAAEEYLLVWTTTPWTVFENRGVGIDSKAVYVKTTLKNKAVFVSKSYAVENNLELLAEFSGADLINKKYVAPDGNLYAVVDASFVKKEVATGLVHLANNYGSDDSKVVTGPPPLLGPDGIFSSGPFKSKHYLTVAESDLQQLGLQVTSKDYSHDVPHCWRCHERLVYLARPAWFLKTTSVAKKMQSDNQLVSWYPASTKDGRYGKWLENNVDWAVSRERFWGTPLPVWQCNNNHQKVVSSKDELASLTKMELSSLDLHRPFVDELVFTCECGSTMNRVPEVVDCWYDAAVAGVTDLPFDFVAEGVDQTRGWFYTLQALAALLGKKHPYKTALSLGHVVDQKGEKMSKHKGNVLDPFALFDEYGADAVRLALLRGDPFSSRRLGTEALVKASAFFKTLWSCHSLVKSAGLLISAEAFSKESYSSLDKWMLVSLNNSVSKVTTALEEYNPGLAVSALESLLEVFSTRYLRAARPLSPASYHTAFKVLETFTTLLAPLTPFFAEGLFKELKDQASLNTVDTASFDYESVHLMPWATFLEEYQKSDFLDAFATTEVMWQWIVKTRALRAKHNLRLRLPLKSLTVRTDYFFPNDLLLVLKDQVNVKEVLVESSLWWVKLNWKALGPRFKGQKEALKALPRTINSKEQLLYIDEHALVLDADYTLSLDSEPSLDMQVTPELFKEGLVADLLREVSVLRQDNGFSSSDIVRLKVADKHKYELLQSVLTVLASRNTTLLDDTESTFDLAL